jgi:tetratricopeptide (TPR) repeat protein
MKQRTGLLLLVTALAMAQTQTSSFDKRLSVNTLLREDIFAGLMGNDVERFDRGMKNVELLLEERPGSRADLLAWRGAGLMTRAVWALERHQDADYAAKYREARAAFEEAVRLDPAGIGVNAIRGGVVVVLGDRLAPEHRAENWALAYESYQILWKQQSKVVEKLPVHNRGELLAGLALTAQRTGRAEESRHFLDEIARLLPGTPYETRAKKWTGAGTVACMTCHEEGRLAARTAALAK